MYCDGVAYSDNALSSINEAALRWAD